MQGECDGVEPVKEHGLLIGRPEHAAQLSQLVGDQDLFPQSNEKAPHPLGSQSGGVGTVFQLLCNVGIADDRPCNELGKHSHIGCQVDQIFLSWLAPVYIHRIADDLEGVEADANGQGDVQQGNPQSGGRVKVFQEEVCVFEVQEKGQADRHGEPAEQFGPFLAPVPLLQEAEAIAGQDGGQHKKDVFRLAPGIEDQAGQQEHCISEAGRSEKVYGQNQREKVV